MLVYRARNDVIITRWKLQIKCRNDHKSWPGSESTIEVYCHCLSVSNLGNVLWCKLGPGIPEINVGLSNEKWFPAGAEWQELGSSSSAKLCSFVVCARWMLHNEGVIKHHASPLSSSDLWPAPGGSGVAHTRPCHRLTPGNHRVHITRHHANNIQPGTTVSCQQPKHQIRILNPSQILDIKRMVGAPI